ncbi:MAG: hypothetical protein AB7U38_11220 [Hyphomicrobiales bacterium]
MMTKLNKTAIARRAAASMLAAGLAMAFTPALAADKDVRLKRGSAPVAVGSAQTGGGSVPKGLVAPKAPVVAGSRQIEVQPKIAIPKAPTAPGGGVARIQVPKAPTAPGGGVARIQIPKAPTAPAAPVTTFVEAPKAGRPKVAAATPAVTFTDAAPPRVNTFAAPAPVAAAPVAAPAPQVAPVAAPVPVATIEPKAVVKPAAPVTHHNSYSAYYGGHAGYYAQPSYGYGYGRGGYGGGYGGFRNCH